MHAYRAAVVGCSRIGAFIDNEVVGRGHHLLPYSHAAGYEACPRTTLIAGADLRPDVLSAFGGRYDVSSEHRYTDYREMILKERPDILSVATQPQHRAAITLFAIEHGVRALYCEKPLCASVMEAEAIAAAVKRHGVALNMGTNRRWNPGYIAIREAIASGAYGALTALVTYGTQTLFNTGSHWFDLLLYLSGDAEVAWVQAFLPDGDASIVGDEVITDPHYQGTIAFTNGVTAHLIPSAQPFAHEAICTLGTISATQHDTCFEARIGSDVHQLPFTPASSTLRLIEDLVHALDSGEPTRGGVDVALVNNAIIFGFLESHRRGGARLSWPLGESPLHFVPQNSAPRQPKYTS
jgi:predicted dehydrogenase